VEGQPKVKRHLDNLRERDTSIVSVADSNDIVVRSIPRRRQLAHEKDAAISVYETDDPKSLRCAWTYF